MKLGIDRPINRIEEKRGGNFDITDTEKNDNEQIDPKFVAARERMQTFLDEHKSLFDHFAGGRVKFILGDGFYFDLVNQEVSVDYKWFFENRYSDEQVFFAVLHELKHYSDFYESPENMLRYNVEYSIEKGRQFGDRILRKIEEKFGDSHPDIIESVTKEIPTGTKNSRTMRAVDTVVQRTFSIYSNIFDDVYVNNEVAMSAPRFERTAGKRNDQDEVTALYREKSFPKTDYTELPRHLQFLYKILREDMVPDETVTVSDEVQKVFDDQIMYMNKRITFQQYLNRAVKRSLLRPAPVQQRYTGLRYVIEPIFSALLSKDIDDWDPNLPDESKGQERQDDDGGGSGGVSNPFDLPFQNEYDEFEQKKSFDQADEDDIIDALEKRQEEIDAENEEEREKKEWDNLSNQEKQNWFRTQRDQTLEEEHNLPEGSMAQLRSIQEKLQPEIERMTLFWKDLLMIQRTIKNVRRLGGAHESGDDINMDILVQQYPQILSGNPDSAQIFKRWEIKEQEITFPEELNLRILADISGSMFGERIDVLKESVVLLLTSLRNFRALIKWQRNKPGAIRTKVDTQVFTFESDVKEVKPFHRNSNEDESVNIARALNTFVASGGNIDHLPLQAARESMEESSEHVERIRMNKALDIVFMITDGGHHEVDAAKVELDRMRHIGAVTRAFQIGDTHEDEDRSFRQVWGAEGLKVGSDVRKLPDHVAETLRDIVASQIRR